MRNQVLFVATLVATAIAPHPLCGHGNRTSNDAETTRAESSTAQSKNRITVPAGTRILIRTVDSIDSSKQKAGFRFTATLETNLQAEDRVVAPRGTTVYGRLAQASSAGKTKGSSELTLELTDIVSTGRPTLCSPAPTRLREKAKGVIPRRRWLVVQVWAHSSEVWLGVERAQESVQRLVRPAELR
jgi:hypothetical protein